MQRTRLIEKTPPIFSTRIRPDVKFLECPIRESMGVLGRKWTALILRDIGFRDINRFNRILESIRGLTPRVLSMRLKELELDGIIEKTENVDSPTRAQWALTEKGRDTLPILLRLMAFGAKWYADQVFEDKEPRSLEKIFSRPETYEIVQRLYES